MKSQPELSLYCKLRAEERSIQKIWYSADTLAELSDAADDAVSELELPTFYERANALLTNDAHPSNRVIAAVRRGENLVEIVDDTITRTTRWQWSRRKRLEHNTYVTELAQVIPSAKYLTEHNPLQPLYGVTEQAGEDRLVIGLISLCASAMSASALQESHIVKEPGLQLAGGLLAGSVFAAALWPVFRSPFRKHELKLLREEAVYVQNALTDA